MHIAIGKGIPSQSNEQEDSSFKNHKNLNSTLKPKVIAPNKSKNDK